MPRLAPLSIETLAPPPSAEREGPLGFVPNSILILARRPQTAKALMHMAGAIMGSGSTIPVDLRNLVAQMTSRAAGCGYCMAHTALTATRIGISEEKEAALWGYETSPLFSQAERAALRVANLAALVPNAVTDDDFAVLHAHFSEEQIVDIVSVIALFGFFNRFNDTMATELESSPIEAGRRFLADQGWTIGKHGGTAS